MSYQITMENKVAVVTGAAQGIGAVSYTHLDVYKRQVPYLSHCIVVGPAEADPWFILT